jgi:hypothetical protein
MASLDATEAIANEAKTANPLTEADVVAYLKAHPDVLMRHPDLLEHLELIHRSGSAVSLIERQVEQLRGRNAKLEDRLGQLLHNALDNERRASSVHKLARTLIRAPSLAATIAGLRLVMREDFRIDDACIGVNASVYKRHDIEGFLPLEAEGPLFRSVENFLRTRLLECGPISPERAQLLFPKVAGIASAAIVPLEKEKHLGFVALGSKDPERFQPRQGKLFLEMTADLLSAALRARLG